ncbi:Mitochondrial transcription factor 1 [Paramyrothecium foliicola]|nr:Mitochondrial transcription factor 1 [Paramyrothecium foliicola]
MLRRIQNGPSTFTRSLRRPASAQPPLRLPDVVRWASASAPDSESASAASTMSFVKAEGPIAKQLHETGVWTKARARSKASKKAKVPVAVDPRRVNVVSEKLCDDIIKYIGPSLVRHRGCDLLDLNPGSGLWSRKLHEFLEPRRHIMMDPDAELYKPFLQPLLEKDSVHMIPQSGFIWKNLLEMLRTSLPDQTATPKGEPPQRNDTLVITANLSMYPKKKFSGFESVSTMILYQFLSAIPTQALFHRYGLVRMLFWVDDDDQRKLIPRSINRRRRSAFEAELSCEWIRQVAGPEVDALDTNNLRDEWINVESGYNALRAMTDQGLAMPADRQTKRYRELSADPSLIGAKLAAARTPVLLRPFVQEMEALEQAKDRSDNTKARLKALRTREKSAQGHYSTYLELMQQREAVLQLFKDGSPDFAAADRAWNERFDNMKKNQRNEFNLLWDGYHIFRQDPPVLHWDRRPYEPLVTRPAEFYPNAPTSLLDIQPKQMHPLFLQHGPGTSRSGDMATVLLRSWYQQTLLPVRRAMDSLWGGFGDLAGSCGSVTDPARGGSPMTGSAALAVRAVNERQWTELVGAWMDWPFRPTYVQLLGRVMEESADGDEDESRSGAMGVAE